MSEPNFQNIPAYQVTKNEDFMSSEQLAHFKNKLNAWLEQLISDAEST